MPVTLTACQLHQHGGWSAASAWPLADLSHPHPGLWSHRMANTSVHLPCPGCPFPIHSAPSLAFYDFATTPVDGLASKSMVQFTGCVSLSERTGALISCAFSKAHPHPARGRELQCGHRFAVLQPLWALVLLALATPTPELSSSQNGFPTLTSACSINVSIWTLGSFSHGQSKCLMKCRH